VEICVAARKSGDASSFVFLIDPLCGWCYAAMPQVMALRQHIGTERVEVIPTGLFAGNGARPMTAQFRDHAWANDQRISALTGQPFSQRYYDHVLSNFSTPFDSGPASLVMALADVLVPGCGFDLLAALQHARFVEGRDLVDRETLTDIVVAAGLNAATIAAAFRNAAQMELAVDRITGGRRQLSRHGLEGVPVLLRQVGDESHVVPNGLLVGSAEELIAHCTRPLSAV
jgi:putative protein-disulfide isomerase